MEFVAQALYFWRQADAAKYMTENRIPAPLEAGPPRPEEIQTHLRHIDRRQWWLWSSTVAVSSQFLWTATV